MLVGWRGEGGPMKPAVLMAACFVWEGKKAVSENLVKTNQNQVGR